LAARITLPDTTPAPDNAGLMTIEEAADYLRFHASTVYRLARQGAIPAVKVGKQWRIHRPTLEEWVRSQMQQPK
jgi:excisionase family DNA binding protein